MEATWRRCGDGRRKDIDPTVHSGLMGTAFTCLRSYEATGGQQDLLLCAEIVDSCAMIARDFTRSLLLPFNFLWFFFFFLPFPGRNDP